MKPIRRRGSCCPLPRPWRSRSRNRCYESVAHVASRSCCCSCCNRRAGAAEQPDKDQWLKGRLFGPELILKHQSKLKLSGQTARRDRRRAQARAGAGRGERLDTDERSLASCRSSSTSIPWTARRCMSGVDRIFAAENRKKRLYVEMLVNIKNVTDRGTGGVSQVGERAAMNTILARLTPMVLAAALVACSGGGGGGRHRSAAHATTASASAGHDQQGGCLSLSQSGDVRRHERRRRSSVIALGYEAWIDQQLQRPASLELPHVQQVFATYPPGADFTRLHEDRVDIWLRHALHAPGSAAPACGLRALARSW